VQTFEQFLRTAAENGEVINTVFEERIFELVGALQRIAGPLEKSGIPYELVGGLAVFIHLENSNPEHSVLTRDVDLMVHRSDLPRIVEVAELNGFRFRHSAGLDMLQFGETTSARNAVHILFSGEKVKASQLEPNPELQPVKVGVHGKDVWIISIADLVKMKLSSFRLKDQVHVKSLDAAGLITSDVENSLSSELRSRLHYTRITE